jgi:hypothetical protein
MDVEASGTIRAWVEARGSTQAKVVDKGGKPYLEIMVGPSRMRNDRAVLVNVEDIWEHLQPPDWWHD